MGLLLTPTLLDSVDWFHNCPQSWKESAYNGLKNTLSREPFKPNRAMKEGQKFEAYVYENANKPKEHQTGTEKFQQVCDHVRGYAYQKKTNRHIVVDGHEFYLFGKMDAYKPNVKIIDIKTTGNYRGRDSYLQKWQHVFYCFTENCKDFLYLIVEWNDAENNDYTIKDVHEIYYHVDFPNELSAHVESGIRNFLKFLDAHEELKRLYFHDYQPAWKRK